MKIIHIFREDKASITMILTLNKHFNNGEHEVCYINTSEEKSLINPKLDIPQHEVIIKNIFDIKGIRTLEKLIDGYDYFCAHWMFTLPPIMVMEMSLLRKTLLNKFVWIEWGSDLYEPGYVLQEANVKPFLKNAFVRGFFSIIYKYVMKNCNSFVAIFPPDCDVYKKLYPKHRAKVFYAPYCGNKIRDTYYHYSSESNLEKTVQSGEPVYIQIGHRASEVMEHIRVLDYLKRFAGENIKIFIPLNYGSVSYGDKVQAYAEKLFPGKTIILRTWMNKNQYLELVEKIDIGIFCADRQVALGNILPMIFANVKLYIPKTSVMYKYFRDMGVPIQPCEMLEEESFESFITPVVTDNKNRFNEYIESFTDYDSKLNCWKVIFDELRTTSK